MKKFVLGLGSVVLLAVVFQASAQSNQVGIIFQAEQNKIVSQVVEEVITVQNSGSNTLDGSLEITFPSQVQLQSANLSNYQYVNGQAVWSVAIAPESSLKIRYVVMPVATGRNLVTRAKFSVNGQTLVETQALSNIGQVQGTATNVPSADNLPRTGMDPIYLLLAILLPAGVYGTTLKTKGR